MKKKRRTVPDDVRVYTVQEVMIILGISSRTAYKLVKSGAFHTVHVGGHYRIPKKSFERWLKSVRYGKRGATR
jgi:excisionase family DNA binding protein